MQISIWDSLIDPDGDPLMPVPYRPTPDGSAAWYRVYIYLRGPDVPFVDSVEYLLPPGFAHRRKRVGATYTNPFFKTVIETTTSRFEIFANVWINSLPRPFRLRHVMRFDGEMRNISFFPSGSLGR
jgi:hypothetical protein